MATKYPPSTLGSSMVGDIGKPQRDVNMSRGDVNHPQNLLQLPGVPGDDTLAVGPLGSGTSR